jgi:hypothetical protein
VTNALYPKFKGALGIGSVDLSDPYLEIRAILVDLGNYTFNVSHEFLSSVAGGARVAVSDPLENVVWDQDLATLNSDDPVLPAVAGASIESVILFIDTGNEATSRLVAYYDTNITGAPLTPTSKDVQIFVPEDGWFAL